MYVLDN